MRRTARNIRRRHAERLEDAAPHPLRDTHAGRPGQDLAEHVEALVGINAAFARRRDGSAPLEGQARGVGEQVTNRRPLGARRIIQAHEAPVDGDEHRPRGNRLGHRGERKNAIDVAVRIDDVAPDTKDEGDIERRQGADHAVASGAGAASAAAVVFSLILRSVRA